MYNTLKGCGYIFISFSWVGAENRFFLIIFWGFRHFDPCMGKFFFVIFLTIDISERPSNCHKLDSVRSTLSVDYFCGSQKYYYNERLTFQYNRLKLYSTVKKSYTIQLAVTNMLCSPKNLQLTIIIKFNDFSFIRHPSQPKNFEIQIMP